MDENLQYAGKNGLCVVANWHTEDASLVQEKEKKKDLNNGFFHFPGPAPRVLERQPALLWPSGLARASGARLARGPNPAPWLARRVALGELPDSCKPQFPHLSHEKNNSTCVTGLCEDEMRPHTESARVHTAPVPGTQSAPSKPWPILPSRLKKDFRFPTTLVNPEYHFFP